MREIDQMIALAEWMGIKCGRCNGTGKYMRYGEHEWFRVCLARQEKASNKQQPETCDHFSYDNAKPYAKLLPELTLDWLHECEEKLKPELRSLYIAHLIRDDWDSARWLSAHATASQRTEALLKTINRWQEASEKGAI